MWNNVAVALIQVFQSILNGGGRTSMKVSHEQRGCFGLCRIMQLDISCFKNLCLDFLV